MKRILSLFIVLVLILSTFASCNLFQPKVEETDIAEAVAELKDMYKKTQNTAIPDGKELAAQIKVGQTIFNIEWTSNNEFVTVENVDGMAVVRISKDVKETTNYTLTANITTDGGQKATFELNAVVTVSFGMITNPEVGVAYKLALLHGNEGCVVYFDGNNYNNYSWYFSYTTDILSAVDVYLEAVEGVEGGYRLYFDKDGVKTYIVAFPRDGDTTKGTLKFDTVVPSEYFTYSTEHNTLVYTSVTGQQFFMGSSGTYKSISCSAIDYLNGATNYPCRLYGAGGEVETLPEQELPTVPENYTSKDVVEALYKLESGQTLEGPYEFTGVITSIKYAYDPAYNNVSVNIVVDGMTDKPVLCYRLNGGEELEVGDTITVFAGITNYNGTYETTSGGVIRNVVKGEGTPDDGGNQGGGETTGAVVLDLMGNANLVTGSGEQNVFAANGITFTNDKASSTSALTVQPSYAQRAYAGSTIKIEYPGMTKIVITFDDYSPDGTKNYMSGMDGMTVAGATITRENDVLTIVFSAPTNVFQSTTLTSQVRIEKIEVYTGEVEGGNGGNEGGNEGGDGPVVTPAYTAPVAGQPYNFFMELPSGKVYFAGSISGNYLATTTDATASVAIYFEEVTGGYHIFFMDGETKTYITAAAYLKDSGYAGCHFSLTTETPTLPWTYNTTYGIIEIFDEISGKSDTFFAGTYGTYNTFSLSGQYYRDQIASGSQYPGRIEIAEGGEVIPPSEGGEVTPPEGGEGGEEGGNSGSTTPDDGLMSIPEVLASAEGTVVKFTGTVHSFYEEWSSYNNCSPYIIDENGNKVLVFRTTTKVTLGDVVTVEGKVTIYNTVAQIAQGSSTVTIDVPHVCSSWNAATCGKDSTCVVCGAAGSEKATGNHNYVDGLCTVCGGSAASMKLLGTLSFSSTSNRTSFDTSKQIWAANGITLTNNKGASTSNVADYSNPARFYKSSQLIVAATGMLKIEFTCNSASYASALKSSITAADGGSVAISGSVVTVTFADPVDSYTIASLTGGQVRVNSITVYVAE